MDKNLSNKYGQKLPDSDKKFKTDAIKTASKRAIQKTAEATDDLIGNKIADKITSPSTKKGAKNDNANNENRSRRKCTQDQSEGGTKKAIHITRRKTANY